MQRMRSTEGSALIEALVAVTVFAATAAAAFNMLAFSLVTARENALNTHAVALAVQEREDLRALTYSQIATRDVFTTASPNLFTNTAFAVHSDVQNDQPAPNMKTVTVTVSWTHRALPRTYTLQTIYTDFSGAGT